MSQREVDWIICSRLDKGPPWVPAIVGVCAECSGKVWVSRSVRRYLREGAGTVCLPCFYDRVRRNPLSVQAPWMCPEVRAELKDVLGIDDREVDRMAVTMWAAIRGAGRG